jgi:hypothetical protein
MRVVVLGGGFGGVATVRHLERVLRRRTDIEITLVSRENPGSAASRGEHQGGHQRTGTFRVHVWTVAFFLRPDITRVDLRVEREQVKHARQLVERSAETDRVSNAS